MGAPHEGEVQRQRCRGAAAVSHSNWRRDPHGTAAAEQRRAGGDPGDGRRAGRDAVAAYEFLRRGAGAPHRAECDAGAADPAATRPRDRRAGRRGSPGRELVSRVPHRSHREGRSHADRRDRARRRVGQGDRARVFPGGDRAQRLRAAARGRGETAGRRGRQRIRDGRARAAHPGAGLLVARRGAEEARD